MTKIYLIAVLSAAAACPSAAQEHRQLGPHQHGHGRLNMAIDGSRVSIGLEVPGDDIAGFEHEPKTPEQKALLDEAKSKLEAPLALFKIPGGAKCKVLQAKAGTQPEHQEPGDEPKPGAGSGDHAGHSEFHAEYTLDCQSPSALTSIGFLYFEAFPRAQELDVAVIGANGQSEYEVTRAKPKLDLSGVM